MFTKEEYARGDAIMLSWHIDDVKGLDHSLTDDEAREVLRRFEQHHEGSQEAMWDDIKLHIDMFKEDKAHD
jgi:hypothetical protein